jgi:hypothetical protein
MSNKKEKKEIVEDFLDADTPIRGQNFCLMSFCDPPKNVVQEKELFTLKEFLKKVEEQFRIICGVLEIKENKVDLIYEKTFKDIETKYDDFKKLNGLDLNSKFNKEVNTDGLLNMHGLKVRGTYDTLREAQLKAKKLQTNDKNFHVFVGQVGYWLPWNPEADDISNQEYGESQLNELVKAHKQNQEDADEHFEDRKRMLQKDAKVKEIKEDINEDEKEGGNVKEIIENIF